MKKNKTIGIDYSLSSPAICVCRGEFKLDNCKIYYLTNVKKYEGNYCNGILFASARKISGTSLRESSMTFKNKRSAHRIQAGSAVWRVGGEPFDRARAHSSAQAWMRRKA